VASIAVRVLELMRSRRGSLGTCAVCGRAVEQRDERLRLPRGGYAHRRCSTYRMRQRELIARRLRA
jgi:hypothetical protein